MDIFDSQHKTLVSSSTKDQDDGVLTHKLDNCTTIPHLWKPRNMETRGLVLHFREQGKYNQTLAVSLPVKGDCLEDSECDLLLPPILLDPNRPLQYRFICPTTPSNPSKVG